MGTGAANYESEDSVGRRFLGSSRSLCVPTWIYVVSRSKHSGAENLIRGWGGGRCVGCCFDEDGGGRSPREALRASRQSSGVDRAWPPRSSPAAPGPRRRPAPSMRSPPPPPPPLRFVRRPTG